MVSSGVVSDIRAEDGNIRYDYFSPLNDPETVLLIDSWENQQSIDIHHESPMMMQIIKLREKYNLSMKVERYFSDEMGIPASDKKYIRE
jgi:quinol monooxygenase YgiN